MGGRPPAARALTRRPPTTGAGSRDQINGIVPARLRANYEVSNATEGAFEQNATLCAAVIRDFLGGWPA